MPSDTSGVRTRRSRNSDLHTANRNKKDEFYTQFTDIEKEMKNYKKEFNDKIDLSDDELRKMLNNINPDKDKR